MFCNQFSTKMCSVCFGVSLATKISGTFCSQLSIFYLYKIFLAQFRWISGPFQAGHFGWFLVLSSSILSRFFCRILVLFNPFFFSISFIGSFWAYQDPISVEFRPNLVNLGSKVKLWNFFFSVSKLSIFYLFKSNWHF